MASAGEISIVLLMAHLHQYSFAHCSKEGIGAGFVGAFEDDKIAKILELPEYVKPVGIIALG